MASTGAHRLERFPLARGRPFLAYGSSIAICILALVIRLVADTVLPSGYPYVAFFPAVVMSTFLFGLGPGVVAAVLCGLMSWYFFIPPAYSMKMSGGIAFALAFYSVVVAIDILLIEWMQRANRRLMAERERSRQLAERGELLFRELQHRVSNNLQVVGGLLAIQMRGISDATARTALEEASRRLALIGRIHRQLYDPHGERLHLRPFLEQLGVDLLDTAGRSGIVYSVEGQGDIKLPAEAAVPMALIVTEAVANAIEHGFAGREDGHITVSIGHADGALELRVDDDGAGLPEGFDLEATNSLGLKLAQMLARQLGGTFSLSRGNERTSALLRLP